MARVDLEIIEPIAWLLSKPKRIKIAVGGRGSQKSTAFADIMLACADKGERVCCAREFQNSIDDSVHENLKQEIDRLGAEGFHTARTEITTETGGYIFYKGLARNITSLKSLTGVKRLWIEEGESVSEESLRVLTPSIRSSAMDNTEDGDPPEIWISMNWGHSTGAIAQKYLKRAEAELRKHGRYEDDLVMIVQVNWRDNLWFPPELEQERQDDYENLPRALYDAIWENAHNDSVMNSIIPLEWFDAAIDAHKKLGFEPEGQKVVSHDPADGGGDPKGLCLRHGSVVLDVQENDTGLLMDGARWALDYTIDNNADLFIWDGDGMGVGIREQVSNSLTGKHTKAHMFRGSGAVDNPESVHLPLAQGKEPINGKKNKDVFLNRRAQRYSDLMNRFYNTFLAVERGVYVDPEKMISIDSSITLLSKLRAEVCSIPRKPTGTGKFQVLDKVTMKKSPYNLPSPNLADSLMMSEDAPVVVNASPVDIQFESLWG